MTLEPILHAPLAVQIHVATVVPAFIIGTYQIFFSRKGEPFHRALSFIYLTLMTITSIAVPAAPRSCTNITTTLRGIWHHARRNLKATSPR